jgi:hypothetical protein
MTTIAFAATAGTGNDPTPTDTLSAPFYDFATGSDTTSSDCEKSFVRTGIVTAGMLAGHASAHLPAAKTSFRFDPAFKFFLH